MSLAPWKRRVALAGVLLSCAGALAAEPVLDVPRPSLRGSYLVSELRQPRPWLFELGWYRRPWDNSLAYRPVYLQYPWDSAPSAFEQSGVVRLAQLFLHNLPAGEIGGLRLKVKIILE